MVRGTNKRIIEINDTQNPYFERAVLYLKDSQADSCKKTLESQAQHFFRQHPRSLAASRPPGVFVQPQIPVAGSFSAAFRSGRRRTDLFAAALTRFTDSGKTFSPNFFFYNANPSKICYNENY